MKQTKISILLALFLLALLLVAPAFAQNTQPTIVVLNAEGPVTSAMNNYIQRGIAHAESIGAELLILELNTPGGSISVMNTIVQQMRNSNVPIVVYVTPKGAMAASAGTIITLAGHANAMAPETTIGAASPVGAQGEDIGETMAAKEKNVLRATVRSLAKTRPAAAIELAEDTIETTKAISSEEALQIGLTDFIAREIDDLLGQLDGHTITVDGTPITLQTKDAVLVRLDQTLVEKLLMMLTNPNLVFLLLTIGIQAIIIELSSPGGWVAGVLGVIFVAIAIYSFGVLPINYFGLVFIVLSFTLFFLEIKAPTHGAMTAAGIAAFITGALILFNSATAPGFPKVSVPLVIGTGIFLAVTFGIIVRFAIRALRVPPQMGRESMVGRKGFVRTDLDPEGTVQLDGELWTAEPVNRRDHIHPGTRIQVVAVNGLKLTVEPYEPTEHHPQ